MSAESRTNVVELEPKNETPIAKTERELYRLVDASAELIGGIGTASTVMGIDRGDWRRTLDRNGRYLAVEHVMRFGERLMQFSPETAQRIATAMMRPFDLIVFPRVQMTAAERARRHENMLRVLGAAMGVDLVAKSLETP
jgi:hypothetical protein